MADWWKDEELVNQVVTEANGGNTAAQCEMARKCMAEQDISEAVKWYKMAAAAGTADAMFNLGLLYSKGWEGETAPKSTSSTRPAMPTSAARSNAS